MTKADFQKNYCTEHKKYIDTSCGQHFLSTLGSMRPAYEYPVQGHLLDENRGAIRGYELCMRNILVLASPPSVSSEIEPTYGVPNRKAE